tara:strand:+ start:3053 stop:3907 length:855 start_codon:yes stop_codon:yes gene_type:complete
MLEGFVHGSNLKNKSEKSGSPELIGAYQDYVTFRNNVSNLNVLKSSDVSMLCKYFNDYRSKVVYLLEKRPSSGQENLRSTMMEEFFVHLFSDLIKSKFENLPKSLFIGKGSGYVDLTFAPNNFVDMFEQPGQYFHSKDQDFMFGVKLAVKIAPYAGDGPSPNSVINVPVVAIECKTYLERNMLDSCAGTASRIKKATPYCLYIISSEYMKLRDSQPELTDIDEVYILCKEKNSERLRKQKNNEPVTPIAEDLIIELFEKVRQHLNKKWWSPDDVLNSGKIINRP